MLLASTAAGVWQPSGNGSLPRGGELIPAGHLPDGAGAQEGGCAEWKRCAVCSFPQEVSKWWLCTSGFGASGSSVEKWLGELVRRRRPGIYGGERSFIKIKDW